MTAGGAEAASLVEVALPVPLRRTFTYRVPASLVPDVARGVRVRVPLGRRSIEGTVVGPSAVPPPADIAVRDVAEVVAHAQTQALGILQELGDGTTVAPPLTVDGERLRYPSPPPALGQDPAR